MIRSIAKSVAALIVILAWGSAMAHAQAAFKIPFKFEAGGKKLPAGEYVIARGNEGQVLLKQEAKGLEVAIPFKEKLAPPDPPFTEPQLVFDAVGNFEPSYTEYFTVYLLAEVWLSGDEGLLIHTTKGSHQNQVVKGQAVIK